MDKSKLCAFKPCAFYQIQKLHAVVIHELIVLTPKIIVQQRKLITMILPLFLDFLAFYEAHSCGLDKIAVERGIANRFEVLKKLA